MPGVASVEPGRASDGVHRYWLGLNSGIADTVAPMVATAAHEAGLKLYALRPETRDLETVFREVNTLTDDQAEVAHG